MTTTLQIHIDNNKAIVFILRSGFSSVSAIIQKLLNSFFFTDISSQIASNGNIFYTNELDKFTLGSLMTFKTNGTIVFRWVYNIIHLLNFKRKCLKSKNEKKKQRQ